MGDLHWSSQKEISHLSAAELLELKDKAEKALPGPYEYNGFGIQLAYEPEDKERTGGAYKGKHICLFMCEDSWYEYDGETEAMAAFFTRTHPGVVKYLVDEILRLRTELSEAKRRG